MVGGGTVGSSNTISRESRLGKAVYAAAEPVSPTGPEEAAEHAESAVRAFVVAKKPGSINRWSEGRQEGR